MENTQLVIRVEEADKVAGLGRTLIFDIFEESRRGRITARKLRHRTIIADALVDLVEGAERESQNV